MPDSEHALIRTLEGGEDSGSGTDSDDDVPLAVRGGRAVKKTPRNEVREVEEPMLLMGHRGRRGGKR
jgi:hypothetical protein